MGPDRFVVCVRNRLRRHILDQCSGLLPLLRGPRMTLLLLLLLLHVHRRRHELRRHQILRSVLQIQGRSGGGYRVSALAK